LAVLRLRHGADSRPLSTSGGSLLAKGQLKPLHPLLVAPDGYLAASERRTDGQAVGF